jgi:hypothetical protein
MGGLEPESGRGRGRAGGAAQGPVGARDAVQSSGTPTHDELRPPVFLSGGFESNGYLLAPPRLVADRQVAPGDPSQCLAYCSNRQGEVLCFKHAQDARPAIESLAPLTTVAPMSPSQRRVIRPSSLSHIFSASVAVGPTLAGRFFRECASALMACGSSSAIRRRPGGTELGREGRGARGRSAP